MIGGILVQCRAAARVAFRAREDEPHSGIHFRNHGRGTHYRRQLLTCPDIPEIPHYLGAARPLHLGQRRLLLRGVVAPEIDSVRHDRNAPHTSSPDALLQHAPAEGVGDHHHVPGTPDQEIFEPEKCARGDTSPAEDAHVHQVVRPQIADLEDQGYAPRRGCDPAGHVGEERRRAGDKYICRTEAGDGVRRAGAHERRVVREGTCKAVSRARVQPGTQYANPRQILGHDQPSAVFRTYTAFGSVRHSGNDRYPCARRNPVFGHLQGAGRARTDFGRELLYEIRDVHVGQCHRIS
jgi:hypothetical protein